MFEAAEIWYNLNKVWGSIYPQQVNWIPFFLLNVRKMILLQFISQFWHKCPIFSRAKLGRVLYFAVLYEKNNCTDRHISQVSWHLHLHHSFLILMFKTSFHNFLDWEDVWERFPPSWKTSRNIPWRWSSVSEWNDGPPRLCFLLPLNNRPRYYFWLNKMDC